MFKFSFKRSHSICVAALAMSISTVSYAADNSNLQGASANGSSTATFALQATSIKSILQGSSSGPYATTDSLSLTAVVNAQSDDVGKQAYIYVVAKYKDTIYNIDSFGLWNQVTDSSSLKPATSIVTLASTNKVNFSSGFNYPGSFQFYVGYQLVDDSNIHYSTTPGEVVISDFVFDEIAYPMTVEEKRLTASTTSFTFKGSSQTIGYNKLISTNDVLPLLGGYGTATFGMLTDKDGQPFLEEDGSAKVCTNGSGPDHTSLLTYENSIFAVTQLECGNGGAYITKLNQAEDGKLTALSTRPVDFSGVYGTYVNCAGMTTPWNTHLGSEEYEPPMINFNANAADQAWLGDSWHDGHLAAVAAYNGLENNAENAAYMGYYYGWIPEIAITSNDGAHTVKKHFAMGRAAFEQGYVMPDNRTVYLSDDGTNTGFYMFIADTAQDLSAGTLYAARWDQTSATGKVGVGEANITWINLGHATNDEIRTAIENKTAFSDMFDKADPVDESAGTCPDGYQSTQANGIFACVKLKDGMDKIASRLEMRLYASVKGATTEFRKEEGITFNPDQNVLYVAMSEVRKGMEDNSSQDIGGYNHVRVAEANSCGAVYGLDIKANASDSGGEVINSNYVVGNMYGVVAGIPKDYTGTELEGNSCDIDGIASPDNVSYLPKYGILLIGEDTGKHQNDLVWSYNVVTEKLTRVAYTPYGSETTSPFWHTNINGFGYVTLVTQHPYGESDSDQAQSSSDKESYVGYIGPFPALD